MSDEKKAASQPTVPRRRLPQFSILGLMVLTFVISVAVTPLFYMVRAEQGQREYGAVGILMAVAMPMLLAVAVSMIYRLVRKVQKQRRRKAALKKKANDVR